MPDSADIFLLLLSLVWGLIGVIALMIYKRMGTLETSVDRLGETLHRRVSGIDNRVVRLETRVGLAPSSHGQQ